MSFIELYSPREGNVLIHKSEKSYWRTQDRVEFALYEDRKNAVLVITAHNVEKTDEIYRTIFLDLEKLYFELEAKAQGHRDPLTKKKNKKLNDEALVKATTDFVLTRLNIKKEPLPWPTFLESVDGTSHDNSTEQRQPDDVGPKDEAAEIMERMCTFDKMSSDSPDLHLEIAPPAIYCATPDGGGVDLEFLRVNPPKPQLGSVEIDTEADKANEKSNGNNEKKVESTENEKKAPAVNKIEKNDKGGKAKSAVGVSAKKSATVAPMGSTSVPSTGKKKSNSAAKNNKSSKKVAPS